MTTVRLGDVTTKIGSGATPRGGEQVYQDSGVPFIRSQNVYNDGFREDGLVFLSAVHASELDHVTVRKGDNLLDITGESVARSCLAPESMDGGRVSQHVAIIRTDGRRLSSRYLHYLLVSPSIQTELLSLASAGATRQALTKVMLQNLRVPCPSLEVQERVAAHIGSLDDKIELNRRMNRTLEEMALALFKSWFVDFDPVHAKAAGKKPWGMDAKTAALFPSNFSGQFQPVLEDLPSSWRIEPLEKLVSVPVRSGVYIPKVERGNGWKLVNMGELFGNPVLFDMEMERVPLGPKEEARFSLESGDVLFARRSMIGTGSSQCSLVWEASTPTTFESSIIRVRCDRLRLEPDYLFQLFWSDWGVQALGSIGRHGPISGITGSDLSRLLIPVPPLELQRAFLLRSQPWLRLRAALRRESAVLAQTRDALLPKLLSGEIRLKGAK